MSRVEAAAGMDRLPWLPDEPAPKTAHRRGKGLLVPAIAAMVLVGGVAAWLGVRSNDQGIPQPKAAKHATVVKLPAARTAEPVVRLPDQPEVRQSAEPEVRPAPTREIRIAPPPARIVTKEAPEAIAQTPKPAVSAPPKAAARPAAVAVPWNPRVFNGAAGRVVQVGAFGSITQAKRGWWYMVRAYPAMSRLPAVVRPSRNSRGRVFYRFQVGTTSQAHSEVLCQRMQRIRFSCAVIGLPWKAKVER
jgi:hypothetical protein